MAKALWPQSQERLVQTVVPVAARLELVMRALTRFALEQTVLSPQAEPWQSLVQQPERRMVLQLFHQGE